VTHEILLNPCNWSGWEYGPTFAPLPGGGFAVAWGDSSAAEYCQLFSSSYAPVGCDFLVAYHPPGSWPGAASSAAGDFVVVWGRNSLGIGGRQYSASGMSYGPGFQINTNPIGLSDDYAALATVAMAPDGRFGVVWLANGSIRARLFDPSANPTTAELVVNQAMGATFYYPTIAYVETDRWVVAWEGPSATDSWGVLTRTLDVGGLPLGPEAQINETTVGYQGIPSVGTGPLGEYVAARGFRGQRRGPGVRPVRSRIRPPGRGPGRRHLRLEHHRVPGTRGVHDPRPRRQLPRTWFVQRPPGLVRKTAFLPVSLALQGRLTVVAPTSPAAPPAAPAIRAPRPSEGAPARRSGSPRPPPRAAAGPPRRGS